MKTVRRPSVVALTLLVTAGVGALMIGGCTAGGEPGLREMLRRWQDETDRSPKRLSRGGGFVSWVVVRLDTGHLGNVGSID